MCWATFVMLQLLSVVTVTHGRETAFLEIILYELNQDNGRYTTYKTDITGKFSSAGSSNAAEGEIVQMHPFSLCDDASNYEEKYEYGWVGVIKLIYTGSDPCQSLVGKAKRAVDKGATAVIFDISDHPGAVQQLSLESRYMVNRPIVLVQGEEAVELMKIIENKQVARARIQRSLPVEDAPSSHFFHNGIIIACLVFVFILGSVIMAKIKCWKRRRQMTFHDLASQALEQMKTKRYIGRKKPHVLDLKKTCEADEKWSLSSGGSICAICLEEFSDGQELRVIPCHHEFHKRCVDPWLKQKWTCPLCNRNILRDFSTLVQQIPSPDATSHPDDERSPLATPVHEPGDTRSGLELASQNSHRSAESDKYEELFRQHLCRTQNTNYASTSNRTYCPSQLCGSNHNVTAYRGREGHLFYSSHCLASRHRTTSGTSDITLPTGNSTCGSKLERDLSTDSNERLNNFQASYTETKRDLPRHIGLCQHSEKLNDKNTSDQIFYCGHTKRKPTLLGGAPGLPSSLPCHTCNGRYTVLQSASTNLGNTDCNFIQSFSRNKSDEPSTKTECLSIHERAPRTFRTPSLRSGYVPDSPDSSDCNFDSHGEVVGEGVSCLHESYPCLNTNLVNVCHACQQRLHSLNNASTQCMHGSLSFTQNPSLFSLYSTKFTEPNQPSPAPAAMVQGMAAGSSSELLGENKLFGRQQRSFTPRIEYSSSDGVEDLARLSNSSLEGVLEALESSSVTSHS